MSNVAEIIKDFHCHLDFEEYQCRSAKYLLEWIRRWIAQRNSYDRTHGGSIYFDQRLETLQNAFAMTINRSERLLVVGTAQNFDEEGTHFSVETFRGSLDMQDRTNSSIGRVVDHRGGMYKHYFYRVFMGGRDSAAPLDVELAGMREFPGDEDTLLEQMMEAIPHADIEAMIGNIILLAYDKDFAPVEFISVVRAMLQRDRAQRLLTAIHDQGVFHVVNGKVDLSGRGVDDLATSVDDVTIFEMVHCGRISDHKARFATFAYIADK